MVGPRRRRTSRRLASGVRAASGAGIGRELRERAERPVVPSWFSGSFAEWVFYRELTRRGMREGVDFVFQDSQLGGRVELGGIVIDFYFPDRALACNVQGVYWHYQRFGGRNRARDELARQELAGVGITLIFVDEDDLLREPSRYVGLALAGIDLSRIGGVG